MGYQAFKKELMGAEPIDPEDFIKFEHRRLRYQILWAMYENTAYSDVHRWAEAYRYDYKLYHSVRSIYNPAYRLAEFWQAHIWGGALDPAAGDGKNPDAPTALPIITDNEALRPAIAKVWEWSNWPVYKDILTLQGAVMGDACIRVVDDAERERVYFELVHPGTLADVTLDRRGNVRGYVIERDIRRGATKYLYREEVTRDGDGVVYRTFRNGSLYAWDGVSAEWSIPYGFVPMVVIQHKNVGLPWGYSELHAGLSSFREVDDVVSALDDQIRKMSNPMWLFTGVSKPKEDANAPAQLRDEMKAIWAGSATNADAKALVAPLDIASASGHMKELLAKIEKDYPELGDNIESAAGDISGRALRINRQPVESKISLRRPNYDDALARAQMMAVAIGGYRGYDAAFSGFGLDSFSAGKLAHSIGNRPGFKKDPTDDLEMEKLLWEAAGAAKNVGVPLSLFLKRQGWNDEQIREYENHPDVILRRRAQEAAVQSASDPDPRRAVA